MGVDGEPDAVEVGVVADADADAVGVELLGNVGVVAVAEVELVVVDAEDVRCPSVVSAVSAEYKQDPVVQYVQVTSSTD